MPGEVASVILHLYNKVLADVYNPMLNRQLYNAPTQTDLVRRNKLGGMVASSPILNCRATKTQMMSAAPTRSPIILALFQGNVDPPH